MKYSISYTKPHNHYIDIEFIAENINADETLIQLPAWRPGRYELGNFAKNIQKWAAFDDKGNSLSFQKITKDSWKVLTKGVKTLHIKYNYFAFELNAGSTFLDDTQLYMNPVNCCVFMPKRINEECLLEINVPTNYKVAIGIASLSLLQGEGKPVLSEVEGGVRSFKFKDYHHLADSPFIASKSLKHESFICNDTTFHLWFQGECKPDWAKLLTDFKKFCSHQLEMMKHFPVKEYHFLFQILPFKIYHGVEHITSTVIALGPSYNLMKGDLYEDLLGVSCHELFHAWNIKTIRPVEMQPYDYTKENYSRLGYVYEGVTTYYGDYLLFRSGVFTEEQYFKTFNERLQKHFDNFGRFNLSVADSSFDTWLDGYVPGIPNRKTNIYDEGNLLAFITDIFIRKNSKNENSLDDVMCHLYNEFALNEKGYSEKDYKGIIEHFANASFNTIFSDYFNGIADYEPLLIDAMDFIGCEIVKTPSLKFHEHALGIKVAELNGIAKVMAIYPNSVADKAGLSINDDIISINNLQIKPDGSGSTFSEWCNYFKNEEMNLIVSSNGTVKQISLTPHPQKYYQIISIQKNNNCNSIQKQNFDKWKN